MLSELISRRWPSYLVFTLLGEYYSWFTCVFMYYCATPTPHRSAVIHPPPQLPTVQFNNNNANTQAMVATNTTAPQERVGNSNSEAYEMRSIHNSPLNNIFPHLALSGVTSRAISGGAPDHLRMSTEEQCEVEDIPNNERRNRLSESTSSTPVDDSDTAPLLVTWSLKRGRWYKQTNTAQLQTNLYLILVHLNVCVNISSLVHRCVCVTVCMWSFNHTHLYFVLINWFLLIL